MELTDTDSPNLVFTHSDIKAFLDCRRAWNWSYVDDLREPERKTGALALGTRVHAALEHYYRTGDDPVLEHDRLFKADLAWAELHGKPWEPDQLYEDAVKGRNCVVAHQQWLEETGEDSRFRVRAVEQTVETEIIPGITLRGKVDILFEDVETGFLYTNDWKTDGGFFGTAVREMLEKSWQHTVYGIASAGAYPDDVIDGAFYTVMKKAARLPAHPSELVHRWAVPGYRKSLARKRVILEQICRDMIDTMRKIELEGTHHAYPMPSQACRWCAFRGVCEVVDESPLAARAMLDEHFIRGARHARYESKST